MLKKFINFKIILIFYILIAPIVSFAQGEDYLSKYKDIVIKVKGDSLFPPFEYINSEGMPDGFNVELFKCLMEKLGLK